MFGLCLCFDYIIRLFLWFGKFGCIFGFVLWFADIFGLISQMEGMLDPFHVGSLQILNVQCAPLCSRYGPLCCRYGPVCCRCGPLCCRCGPVCHCCSHPVE
uniref:Uncharacterized protein n=1 Tax=Cacopsylla melanoneura TaxID=428564 RepID=A0A8D8TVZ8_9HEMI